MSERRKIIFSFDDGPAPIGALNGILKALKQNAVKAEFYVLGSEVEKNVAAAKSIVHQGHSIQNHSWSHPNLATATETRVLSELERTQKIIEKVTGVKPTRVRPPYGAGGWPRKPDPELANVARSLSLSIHNWDIDTEDWRAPKGIGAAKIEMMKKQFDRTRGRAILNVLMHVQNETARDLHDFISYLKSADFTFAVPQQ